MSWDEAFSDHYDEWAAAMTADVAFYVELAREAEGPLVELAVGNGRVAIPVAQATGQQVIGIDTSPAMLEQARRGRRGRRRARPARGRHARSRSRRAGGAHLLPVPGAPAPADLGRPPPHVRAGRRLAPAGRAVRLERVRLRPPVRRSGRRCPRGRASTAYHPLRGRREPDRHCARRRRRRAPSGGRRRTSGSDSSTSPASRWRRSTAASPASHSRTKAASTCSSHCARAP